MFCFCYSVTFKLKNCLTCSLLSLVLFVMVSLRKMQPWCDGGWISEVPFPWSWDESGGGKESYHSWMVCRVGKSMHWITLNYQKCISHPAPSLLPCSWWHHGSILTEERTALLVSKCKDFCIVLCLHAHGIYLQKGIGLIAINDSFWIESTIYKILKKYFRSDSYYINVVELFHEVCDTTKADSVILLLIHINGTVRNKTNLGMHNVIEMFESLSLWLPT